MASQVIMAISLINKRTSRWVIKKVRRRKRKSQHAVELQSSNKSDKI